MYARIRSSWRALGFSLFLGARSVVFQKTALISLLISYLIGKGLWAGVWGMASLEILTQLDITRPEILWYSVLTGCVNYPLVRKYRAIEEDIHTGAVDVFFTRPMGYLLLKISEGLGEACVRAAALIVVATGFSYSITGQWLLTEWRFPAFVITTALGLVLWLLIHTMIGLSAGWMRSTRPVYLLVSKGVLVLGGVVLPITLYPPWVENVAWLTPFPALLYIPARMALTSTSPNLFAWGLIIQVMWIGIACAGAVVMEKKLARRVLKG